MTTFLDEFTAYLQAQDRSPHTVKAYRSDVAAFFDWLTAQLGRPLPPIEVMPLTCVNRSLAALLGHSSV